MQPHEVLALMASLTVLGEAVVISVMAVAVYPLLPSEEARATPAVAPAS